MNLLVEATNIVSMVAFGVALIIVLTIRVDSGNRAEQGAKSVLAIAMGLYAFVGVSNVLEWAGITSALEPYEDYAGLLFMPLMAYAVFSLSVMRQVEAADRSERAMRREHELLATVVDTTPTGIVAVGQDGGVVFANDPARRLFAIGEDGETGVLSASPAVRVGGQLADWSDAHSAFKNMATGPTLHDSLRFVASPEGEITTLSASTKHVSDDERDITVIALADITERIRYRQDLERLVSERTEELVDVNRRLEDADFARREFVARMSHQLRTPLNSVIGFSGVLLGGMAGPLSDEQAKQVAMVQRAGHQLLGIVNDVVDIARVESGRLAIADEDVELSSFAESVVETVRYKATDRSIDVDVLCTPDAGSIRTDSGKLEQILRNILGNAVTYTDPGGAVTVRIARDGGVVTIAVEDTGIGIDAHDLPTIFEPFQQVQTSDRTMPHGAGLGLAVARDLAVLLGGAISVRSTPGVGSAFTLRLPVRRG